MMSDTLYTETYKSKDRSISVEVAIFDRLNSIELQEKLKPKIKDFLSQIDEIVRFHQEHQDVAKVD